jgi:UDP-GlcNAc:undecaprenyl-phosphate GlcNAc-1-phosphate transferase
MQYLLPFILAMVVTVAGLPVLVRFANRWLFVDQPGERKVHSLPIPRVGGLAMALGVLVAAGATVDLQAQDRWFLVAAAVLVAFGALDDRLNLDYRIKLIGQVLAVGIVITLGKVQIQTFTLDDRFMLPGWVSMPLTAFFLVGVTNAINLADGLDGLAGGTTFLCLCAIALLSSMGDPGTSAALALTFAGAVLGFLRFNTYPASVFMGDAGSQLLGFAIGVLSVRATQNLASQVSAALPVLLLALPILDTLSVMVQRIGEGRSPFSADRNHIHHKLLALGFDQHEAVMLIYVIQASLFVLAYFMRYESDLHILAVVSAFFVISIVLLQAAAHTGWRLRDQSRPVHDGPVSRFVSVIRHAKVLPRLSYVAIAAALGAYAILIVVDTASLSRDIRVLVIALLAVVVAILGVMRVAPLSLVEKAALYVTATVLVYLDALALPSNRLVSILSWIAVSVAAVATVIRLRSSSDRRFELTPLDVIVVFMALVVPSLPGILGLPHGVALAIAKLVVVFYAIAMLLSRAEDKAVWVRIAAVSILASLTVRSFVTF